MESPWELRILYAREDASAQSVISQIDVGQQPWFPSCTVAYDAKAACNMALA
jgi:hypothetical protein